MRKDAVASAIDRGRASPEMDPVFFSVDWGLAVRCAARDAHRSECLVDALECSVCRAHAERIAEAKFALRRERFP
jgi:hypothetical protein